MRHEQCHDVQPRGVAALGAAREELGRLEVLALDVGQPTRPRQARQQQPRLERAVGHAHPARRLEHALGHHPRRVQIAPVGERVGQVEAGHRLPDQVAGLHGVVVDLPLIGDRLVQPPQRQVHQRAARARRAGPARPGQLPGAHQLVPGLDGAVEHRQGLFVVSQITQQVAQVVPRAHQRRAVVARAEHRPGLPRQLQPLGGAPQAAQHEAQR